MGTVQLRSGYLQNLTVGQTSIGAGAWRYKEAPYSAFQATVSGTGAVTATVTIEVSNDGVNTIGTVMGTISLSGTTSASDGFTSQAPWKYVRANVTGLTGTGATVDVVMSV